MLQFPKHFDCFRGILVSVVLNRRSFQGSQNNVYPRSSAALQLGLFTICSRIIVFVQKVTLISCRMKIRSSDFDLVVKKYFYIASDSIDSQMEGRPDINRRQINSLGACYGTYFDYIFFVFFFYINDFQFVSNNHHGGY